MNSYKQAWLDALGEPSVPVDNGPLCLLASYEYETFTLELYRQPLENGTWQRVMMAFPRNVSFPAPAVVTPFYYPEAMLGFDPATGEKLEFFAGIEMMLHLVHRGYITACADSYHLSYLPGEKSRDDFSRWKDAAQALYRDHPRWSGMGKLVSDTRRLVDAVAADPRTDESRIGIAGHSLGGKMAFYAGCLDDRIKVILSSDFGFGWAQSNWNDPWYWNGGVEALIAMGLDHTGLLSLAASKPFCLLAGEYDDETSGVLMRKAAGYQACPDALRLIHHARGHRPPMDALEEGYAFLNRVLQNIS